MITFVVLVLKRCYLQSLILHYILHPERRDDACAHTNVMFFFFATILFRREGKDDEKGKKGKEEKEGKKKKSKFFSLYLVY